MADHDESWVERETCARCGDPIEVSSWHPVAAWSETDGETWLVAFCGRACRAAWERERIEE